MKKALIALAFATLASQAQANTILGQIECTNNSFATSLNGMTEAVSESYIYSGDAFYQFRSLTRSTDANTTAETFSIGASDQTGMAEAGVGFGRGSTIILKLANGIQFDLTCS